MKYIAASFENDVCFKSVKSCKSVISFRLDTSRFDPTKAWNEVTEEGKWQMIRIAEGTEGNSHIDLNISYKEGKTLWAEVNWHNFSCT